MDVSSGVFTLWRFCISSLHLNDLLEINLWSVGLRSTYGPFRIICPFKPIGFGFPGPDWGVCSSLAFGVNFTVFTLLLLWFGGKVQFKGIFT